MFLCGLWVPIWILMALLDDPAWHCSFCGYSDSTKYLQNPHLKRQELAASEQARRFREVRELEIADRTFKERIATSDWTISGHLWR